MYVAMTNIIVSSSFQQCDSKTKKDKQQMKLIILLI